MKQEFEGILRKLSPTLRRITHRLNGHFSFFDEDDLFQEALEHLWVAYEQGELDDKTDSYVLQGCYFHLKNYLRKTLDKMRLASLDAALDEDDSTLQDFLIYRNRDPLHDLDIASLVKIAGSCGLNEREMAVLMLSLNGLTVREIGQRLSVSHVVVIKSRSRIKNKCKKFKNILKEGYQN